MLSAALSVTGIRADALARPARAISAMTMLVGRDGQGVSEGRARLGPVPGETRGPKKGRVCE